MVSTNNLLLLMLGLELLSLASYSLAGFHKGDKRSAEAALKYVDLRRALGRASCCTASACSTA